MALRISGLLGMPALNGPEMVARLRGMALRP